MWGVRGLTQKKGGYAETAQSTIRGARNVET